MHTHIHPPPSAQVNFRGSAGLGKAFINAGNRQWGVGAMQHDLTDAVKWAVAKGIADPARVCIMGGSYGGYASLAGVTFTPELYRCGVPMFAISNVATFQKSIPPYWRPLRYEFLARVGDAEGNATFNREISPLFHADAIRAPLLIAAGANDVRVPRAETDQIFEKVKDLGLVGAEYAVYKDEGHGLVRPANRLDFYGRVEAFLAAQLGGARGPPAAQARGASVSVRRVEPRAAARRELQRQRQRRRE